VAAGLAGVAVIGALGLYLMLGRPDLADRPMALREAEAEAWLGARAGRPRPRRRRWRRGG
ncbi:MAG: hypothetical protein ACO3BE_09100, partial [Gemmobacter sp.]